MNKTTKKKLKKLLKENPEQTPNMKINEIMHKIKFKNKTKIIDETQDAILPANLELLKIDGVKEEKNLYLYHFIKIHPKTPTIIFCNSINSVKRTQAFLAASGVHVVCLHAQLQQRQRMKKIDQFREGKCHVLISTDVASRGLDIPEVDLVVHYHIPKDIDTFIHRCGRTARLGRQGKSIILADGDDNGRFKKYKADLEDSKSAKNKNQSNSLGGGKELADEDKIEQRSLRSKNGSRIKKIFVPIRKLDEIRDIVNQAEELEKDQFNLTKDVRE
jgi:ATP-dependent RNA helicase DDX24/MAK5